MDSLYIMDLNESDLKKAIKDAEKIKGFVLGKLKSLKESADLENLKDETES